MKIAAPSSAAASGASRIAAGPADGSGTGRARLHASRRATSGASTTPPAAAASAASVVSPAARKRLLRSAVVITTPAAAPAAADPASRNATARAHAGPCARRPQAAARATSSAAAPTPTPSAASIAAASTAVASVTRTPRPDQQRRPDPVGESHESAGDAARKRARTYGQSRRPFIHSAWKLSRDLSSISELIEGGPGPDYGDTQTGSASLKPRGAPL